MNWAQRCWGCPDCRFLTPTLTSCGNRRFCFDTQIHSDGSDNAASLNRSLLIAQRLCVYAFRSDRRIFDNNDMLLFMVFIFTFMLFLAENAKQTQTHAQKHKNKPVYRIYKHHYCFFSISCRLNVWYSFDYFLVFLTENMTINTLNVEINQHVSRSLCWDQ